MPKILLHLCCGPCALYPVDYLKKAGFEVTALFYNPNIHPLGEYLKRREAVASCAEFLDIKVIYKDVEYNPVVFTRETAFRENNRCFHCYYLRLSETVEKAVNGGFDFFSTTLLYSKFQKHDTIRRLGIDLSVGLASQFFYHDFREGWKEGIRISKEIGLYRQQYCGCIFSEFERYKPDLDKIVKASARL